MSRSTLVDPSTLHRGDRLRFGSSKAEYQLQWWEERQPDKMYLVCFGPLGSQFASCGRAFYVGPKSTTAVDPVTGKRRKLKPEKVRLVK